MAGTRGRDTQHSVLLAPGKAGIVFLMFVFKPKFPIISVTKEIMVRPEKCDAGSKKGKGEEQIHL